MELTTTTHIENRLASIDKEYQKRITDLLNLETEVSFQERLTELKNLIVNKMVVQMFAINIEGDLLDALKKR